MHDMRLHVYGAHIFSAEPLSREGLPGGPGEAFARTALAGAPALRDVRMPAGANADAGGPGEAFERTALAAASALCDVPMPAGANARAGGPGEAFARIAMSAVRNSAKSSGHHQVGHLPRVPSAERLRMFTARDTELDHRRKRKRHLPPMPPGCSPPRLVLNVANPGNSNARKTSAHAFSEDCILVE